MSGELLLASNSTNPGSGYLDHLSDAVVTHFSGCRRIAFVPYALHDLDGYAHTTETRFGDLDLSLESVHRSPDPAAALDEADGVFVGGGNTFRLLDGVVRLDLVERIRRLVSEGHPYMGSSAGSNLACPTIKTTNDMPIVQPPTFAALGLVPFQINAHYVDRDPDVAHGGETRRQRIAEFHEEDSTPVIGLREGSWLLVSGDQVDLGGAGDALLFTAGSPARPLRPGRISPLPAQDP